LFHGLKFLFPTFRVIVFLSVTHTHLFTQSTSLSLSFKHTHKHTHSHTNSLTHTHTNSHTQTHTLAHIHSYKTPSLTQAYMQWEFTCCFQKPLVLQRNFDDRKCSTNSTIKNFFGRRLKESPFLYTDLIQQSHLFVITIGGWYYYLWYN